MLPNPHKREPSSRATALGHCSGRWAQGPRTLQLASLPPCTWGLLLHPAVNWWGRSPQFCSQKRNQGPRGSDSIQTLHSEVAEPGSLSAKPQGHPGGDTRWFRHLEGPHFQRAPAVTGETLSSMVRFLHWEGRWGWNRYPAESPRMPSTSQLWQSPEWFLPAAALPSLGGKWLEAVSDSWLVFRKPLLNKQMSKWEQINYLINRANEYCPEGAFRSFKCPGVRANGLVSAGPRSIREGWRSCIWKAEV